MDLTCKACLCALLFPALLNAQEVGLLRLKRNQPAREEKVSVWGGVEEGWFRPSYAGTLQWSAGARAEGIRHGKSTSWKGLVSLEQKTGYGMLSSMFLDPGYFPVDLLEFTPGTKSRETGRLEAGFVSDLGYEWAAGLEASFEAGYTGKRTGLRHAAFGLDFQLEPTVTYVVDDNIGLAIAYVFRLRTERVQLHPSDGAASVFLDRGLRYGSFLTGEETFPVRELSNGFAGQLYSEDVSAGLDWIWKRGQADAADFSFPGSTVSLFYEQTIQANAADHIVRLSYRRERDQLRENIAGAGISDVSDRVGRSGELKYGIRFLRSRVKYVGIALEGQRWVERSMAPNWDQTKRNLGMATLSSSFSLGAIDLDLEALAGGGLWRDRGRSRDEATDMPYRRTEDWLRLMDYYMAPRVGVGGTITYRLPSVQGLFLQLEGRWLHALRKTAAGGQNRETANVTVGYEF